MEEIAKLSFFRSYHETIQKLEDPMDRLALYEAITGYVFDGTEPDFDGILDFAWGLIKPNLLSSVSKSKAGSEGGKASRRNKAESKPPSKLASKEISKLSSKEITDKEGEGEEEEEKEEEEDVENAQGRECPFSVRCIGAFNAVMGTAYGTCPPSIAEWLNDQEGRYTIEDVRAMVEFKRDEWMGTEFQRNLVPKTLFSADHFEGYVAQSKMPRPEGGDDDFSRYARPAEVLVL